MDDAAPALLRDIWYFAMPSQDLARGAMLGKMLLGDPVLFLRDGAGKVSALRDICPHRAIPLSRGTFDGAEVECCYHGWRFNCEGTCTAIPSLADHEKIVPGNIRVKHYPVADVQGNIWIFMASSPEQAKSADPAAIPRLADFPESATSALAVRIEFPCSIDHAVVGLMDPAHGPFVHQSWWWRNRSSIHEKAKAFRPSPNGFTMLRHKPSSNSFAYKIIGGKPETEIRFALPGVRIENIAAGRHCIANLTTVTPLDENRTEITNQFYWTLPALTLVKPIVRFFVRRFLGQDRRAVVWQQEGLKHEKNLLLIRDADTQARWYYQLKNEHMRASNENRPFRNPVPETILRWRS